MSVDTNGIRFLELSHPTNGRRITRLMYRGWYVDADTTAAIVSVPAQAVDAQHAEDFVHCLAAARAFAAQHAPITRRPALTPDLGVPPAAEPTLAVLISILSAAKAIAADQWHVTNCDIYVCTRIAWERAHIDVAFAAVMRALREGLTAHPADRLSEVNDQARRRADIVAFFDLAIGALRCSDQVGGAA
ncbi:MAG: hypothetical protein WCE30_00940 [Mycobacterium sp.]